MTLYFIGTLHANFTPHKELVSEVNSISPDVLLVEIIQEDIDSFDIENYPDEMRALYAWAIKDGTPVYGYDVNIQTLAANQTDVDNKNVINEQAKILEQYSWKEVNKSEINKLFDLVPGAKELVDNDKVERRNQVMKRNISSIVEDNQGSNIVVLTGCGHLDFFEQEFKDAYFPLRNV